MSALEKMLWRIGAAVTIAAAVIAFGLYIYTWNTYYDTLPSSLDRASGRVYVDNFHGFARYENRQEYTRLHTLNDLSEALVLVVLAGVAIHEWRERRVNREIGLQRN